jgi:hypothetical protein
MSAAATFYAWLQACAATHKGPSATNALHTANGIVYYVDPNPRTQSNGAIVGRMAKRRAGHPMSDAGAFKIAADGSVVSIPAELADLLPGASSAAGSTEREEMAS